MLSGLADKLVAENKRLRESPWRMIASAPKDGIDIVYFDDDPSVGICHWDGESWWDRDRDQICYPVLWVSGPKTADLTAVEQQEAMK